MGMNACGPSTFILVLAVVSLRAAAQPRPFPGHSRMQGSYDVAMFGIGTEADVAGPVIDYTFDQNATHQIGDVVYSIPDQVQLIANVPSGKCTAEAFSTASSFEFAQSYLARFNTNVDSFFGLFTASASFAVGEAISFQVNDSVAVGLSLCEYNSHRVDMKPWYEVTPGADMTAAVKHLLVHDPSWATNAAGWKTFFQDWGTTRLTKATFGGSIGSIWATLMSSFTAKGDVWARGEISAQLLWFIEANGGETGRMSGASSEFLKVSTNSSWWRGGGCSPPSCNFSDWEKHIQHEPALVKTEFETLTGLLSLIDANVSAASVAAIGNFTALEFLQKTVLPLLVTYRKFMSNVSIPENFCNLTSSIPECANAQGHEGTCCSGISSVQPDARAIAVNSDNVVRAISDVIDGIELNLLEQSVTSLAVDIYVLELEKYAALYAQGTTTAFCNLQYTYSGECPYGWTPRAAQGLVGPACGKSHTNVACGPQGVFLPYSACCFNSSYWGEGCPVLCPFASRTIASQGEAVWPTALSGKAV